MAVSSNTRYREVNRPRLHALLRHWLSGLPPDGWEGSVNDLWAELQAVQVWTKCPAFIPGGSALGARLRAEAAFLAAEGWRLR